MRISDDYEAVLGYGGEGGKPEPAKPKPAEKPAPDKATEPVTPNEPAPKA